MFCLNWVFSYVSPQHLYFLQQLAASPLANPSLHLELMAHFPAFHWVLHAQGGFGNSGMSHLIFPQPHPQRCSLHLGVLETASLASAELLVDLTNWIGSSSTCPWNPDRDTLENQHSGPSCMQLRQKVSLHYCAQISLLPFCLWPPVHKCFVSVCWLIDWLTAFISTQAYLLSTWYVQSLFQIL